MRRRGKGLLQVIMTLGIAACVGVAGFSGVVAPEVMAEVELDVIVPGNEAITYEEVNGQMGDVRPTIDLKGNSVIITEYTEGETEYIRIYKDNNKNGVIDTEGTVDELLTVGETMNFPVNSTIYGVKGRKLEESISITVQSGQIYTIYGVSEGAIMLEDKTQDAVTVKVVDGVIDYLYGASFSNVVGNINVDCQATVYPEENNISYIYGCSGSSIDNMVVDGSVIVNLDNVRGNSSYGSNSAKITGNLTYTSGEKCLFEYSVNVDNISVVGGDVKATLYGNYNVDSASNSIYGIKTRSGGEEPSDAVGGNYNFNYKGGKAGSVYATYTSGTLAKITGNVLITYEAGEIETFTTGLCDIVTEGNFTFTVKEQCKISNVFRIAQNSTISGDATVDIKNGNDSDSLAELYGMQFTNVGGEVNYTIDGGYYTYLVAIAGANAEQRTVGGDLTLEIKNVNDSTYSGNSAISYGAWRMDVTGELKVSVKDSYFNSIHAICECKSEKNVITDVDNVVATDHVVGASLSGAKAVTCTIDDMEGKSIYGVEITSDVGIDSVDCTMRNVVASSTLYGIYGNSSAKVVNNVDVTLNNCSAQYYYGGSHLKVIGDANLTFMGGSVGDAENEGLAYCLSSSVIEGTTILKEEDLDIVGTNCLREFSSDEAQGPIYAWYDNSFYCKGDYTFVESEDYKKVTIESGNIYIPKDIVIATSDLEFTTGNMYLAGKMNASATAEENAGEYYYAVNVTADAVGGSVTNPQGTITNAIAGEQLFAKAGDKVSFDIKAIDEYWVDKVTVTYADSEEAVALAANEGVYSFDMENRPCEVVVKFATAEKPVHTHVHDMKYDATNHWDECGCGEKVNVAAHTYDGGTVVRPATETSTGVKEYICTVCRYIKQEEIPAIVDDEKSDDETKEEIKLEEGAKIENEFGDFIVEEDDGELSVVYKKPVNSKATKVIIPDCIEENGVTYKVTAIEDGAFKNNKKIKSVVIGKYVESIGEKAFYKCNALTKITIPASVKEIEESAFYNCIKLATVTFGKNSKLEEIEKKAFAKCTALKKISIPNKVEEMGVSAFEGCSKMTSVTIGKAVKKIGSKAFYNCKKLKTITINTSKLTKKSIGSKAFSKAGSNYYSKMVVKVSSKKYKTYKSYLVKAGLSKKAKIKKL